MFFGKKHDEKCARCGGTLKSDFSYCPYCGMNLVNREQVSKEYGLLGKNDAVDEDTMSNLNSFNFGITDNLFNSVLNNLVKNLDKQMARDMQNAEITPMPNGFKIMIGGQQPRKKQPSPKTTARKITDEQMQRIASLPKKEVKSVIRRFGDKLVYELAMPGVSSTDDVFVSKLESGYEVKALGKRNMFVNRLHVDLPLRGIGLEKNKVVVEFSQKE